MPSLDQPSRGSRHDSGRYPHADGAGKRTITINELERQPFALVALEVDGS